MLLRSCVDGPTSPGARLAHSLCPISFFPCPASSAHEYVLRRQLRASSVLDACRRPEFCGSASAAWQAGASGELRPGRELCLSSVARAAARREHPLVRPHGMQPQTMISSPATVGALCPGTWGRTAKARPCYCAVRRLRPNPNDVVSVSGSCSRTAEAWGSFAFRTSQGGQLGARRPTQSGQRASPRATYSGIERT